MKINTRRKAPLTDNEHPQGAEIDLLRRRDFIFLLHNPVCDCQRTLPLILCVKCVSVRRLNVEFSALPPEAKRNFQLGLTGVRITRREGNPESS